MFRVAMSPRNINHRPRQTIRPVSITGVALDGNGTMLGKTSMTVAINWNINPFTAELFFKAWHVS